MSRGRPPKSYVNDEHEQEESTQENERLNYIKNVLAQLEDTWLRKPDFRLGQVVCQALPQGIADNEIYFMRDDRLLRDINRRLDQILVK